MALADVFDVFFNELGVAVGISLAIAVTVLFVLLVLAGGVVGWFIDVDDTSTALILLIGALLIVMDIGVASVLGFGLLALGTVSFVQDAI